MTRTEKAGHTAKSPIDTIKVMQMTCCNICDIEDGDTDAMYTCSKHQIHMCALDARCKDPDLYCKFRPSCMIHFLDKERARDAKKGAS